MCRLIMNNQTINHAFCIKPSSCNVSFNIVSEFNWVFLDFDLLSLFMGTKMSSLRHQHVELTWLDMWADILNKNTATWIHDRYRE